MSALINKCIYTNNADVWYLFTHQFAFTDLIREMFPNKHISNISIVSNIITCLRKCNVLQNQFLNPPFSVIMHLVGISYFYLQRNQVVGNAWTSFLWTQHTFHRPFFGTYVQLRSQHPCWSRWLKQTLVVVANPLFLSLLDDCVWTTHFTINDLKSQWHAMPFFTINISKWFVYYSLI